jgi:hypothetical protein
MGFYTQKPVNIKRPSCLVSCYQIFQTKYQYNLRTISEVKMFINQHPVQQRTWDRGGTVVKVLCYKSEVRWFDSGWFHWNFSLT